MVDYSGLVQRTKTLIHTKKKSGSCVCVLSFTIAFIKGNFLWSVLPCIKIFNFAFHLTGQLLHILYEVDSAF